MRAILDLSATDLSFCEALLVMFLLGLLLGILAERMRRRWVDRGKAARQVSSSVVEAEPARFEDFDGNLPLVQGPALESYGERLPLLQSFCPRRPENSRTCQEGGAR